MFRFLSNWLIWDHSDLAPSLSIRLREQLEDRTLFDAASIIDMEMFAGSPMIHSDPFGMDQCASCVEIGQTAAIATVNESPSREVAFIDQGIDNYRALAAELAETGVTVHVLDSNADGVHQMLAALDGTTDIDAIHLYAHGDAGELRIGNSVLDNVSIQGRYVEALKQLGNGLADDADFLIYGCNFGAEDGAKAAAALSELTGADVAASDDLTGHAIDGGDWDLEFVIGSVEAETRQLASLQGVLNPDFFVTKDNGQTSVSPDDSVSYTVTVRNNGTSHGSNVVVTDTYPANLLETVVADGGGVVDAAAGTITWNLANLNVGESVSYTVSGQLVSAVPAGVDSLTNTVSVADDGTNGADSYLPDNTYSDTDTLVAVPDLSITKTDNGASVSSGSTVVYTLTYTNEGNQDATGVVLTESLPAGTSFNAQQSDSGWVQNGSQYTFAAGPLDVGEVRQVAFAITVTDATAAGELLTNSASIEDNGLNGADANSNNNTATDTTPVAGGSIEGFVYNDGNGNGVFDSGEMPLAGVTVLITGPDGNGGQTTYTLETDQDGRYYIADLPAGDYEIRQVQPENFSDGQTSSGVGGANVEDNVIYFALSAGESAAANNFGEAGLAPGSVSKRYYLTSTESGVYDDVVLNGNVAAPAGFQQTASGLEYRVLTPGTGNFPAASDSVTVNYRGFLVNDDDSEGDEFDSSPAGSPVTFSLAQVIDGWTEGLQLVSEGGTIELRIPPELGYGATGSPSGAVPPNATIGFVVDLISIA